MHCGFGREGRCLSPRLKEEISQHQVAVDSAHAAGRDGGVMASVIPLPSRHFLLFRSLTACSGRDPPASYLASALPKYARAHSAFILIAVFLTYPVCRHDQLLHEVTPP